MRTSAVATAIAALLTVLGCGHGHHGPTDPGWPTTTPLPGTGGGDPVTETRTVGGFDAVYLTGPGTLTIEQTGKESLRITAAAAVLQRVISQIEGGRLLLGPRSDTTFSTTPAISYRLTVAALSEIAVVGDAEVEAVGLDTDRLVVTITGTARVRVSGRADRLTVALLGTGSFRGDDLQSRRVTVDLTGTGNAVVRARERLIARILGTGTVEYIGNPELEVAVLGGGAVRKH